ncbi:MAG: DUF1573 domain-containing protein [Flavobacteriales bacterium]|nr:DUF1573 domain-containing protein [Flavobacteriales bacterium]
MNAPIATITLALTFLMGTHASRQRTGHEMTERGPRIGFIDPMVHDYGAITYGSAGRCSFRFINTGDAPLVIEAFQSSCGCLVPYFDREPVLPGDTASVGLKYDTHRAGRINKSATLRSNALNTPVVTLRIVGTVLPDSASRHAPIAR